MAGKGVVRSIKNYAKGFSEVQIKVREATSNDPNGPSGPLMNDIAQHTFNEHDFIEIMDMIDKRLNDKGKNWRHVFKALVLLDFCLHVGSQNVVLYAKENVYVIRTLKEFQHVDESRRDVGHNVRQKAKELTLLLMNDEKLKEERNNRDYMQEYMMNNSTSLIRRNNGEPDVYRNPGYMDEEKDLKRAIDESRRLAEQESKKRGDSDSDLARAIQESEQEARETEKKKQEQLDKENFNNLFSPPAITGGQSSIFNSAFPSQPNPYASPNPYLQSTAQWPQSTGMSFHVPITAKNPYPSSSQTSNAFSGLQTPNSFQGTNSYNTSQGTNSFQGTNSYNTSQDLNGFQTNNGFNPSQGHAGLNGSQATHPFNGLQTPNRLNGTEAAHPFNGLQAQMTGFPTGGYGSPSAYSSPHTQPPTTGFQPSHSPFQQATPTGFQSLSPSLTGFQSSPFPSMSFQPPTAGSHNPFGPTQTAGQDRFNPMLMHPSK